MIGAILSTPHHATILFLHDGTYNLSPVTKCNSRIQIIPPGRNEIVARSDVLNIATIMGQKMSHENQCVRAMLTLTYSAVL